MQLSPSIHHHHSYVKYSGHCVIITNAILINIFTTLVLLHKFQSKLGRVYPFPHSPTKISSIHQINAAPRLARNHMHPEEPKQSQYICHLFSLPHIILDSWILPLIRYSPLNNSNLRFLLLNLLNNSALR